MTIRRILIVLFLMICCVSSAVSEDRIIIESVTVPPGAQGVTLGVYIANDSDLAGIVIPLEFRSVESGAYIADSLSVTFQGRLTNWDMPDSSYAFKLFFATKTTPSYSDSFGCIQDSSGEVWQYPTDSLDFISPDAFLYAAVGNGMDSISTGDDGIPGSGTPSMLLTFNVTDSVGSFEVRQGCTWPQNNVEFAFIDDRSNENISFTNGIVRVVDSCFCSCHGDPVCDSIHNVLDFVAVIDVAFRGADPIPDPSLFCPFETTDVDCDSDTDVIDVTLMNQVVSYGANPDSTFCDPCAP